MSKITKNIVANLVADAILTINPIPKSIKKTWVEVYGPGIDSVVHVSFFGPDNREDEFIITVQRVKKA